MLHRCRALIRILGCGLLSMRAATAQAPSLPALPEFDDGKLTALSFIAENDVIFQLGRNHDRNYTGGFAFQGSGSFVRRAHLDAPLRGLDRLTGMHRAHAFSPRRFYTLTLVGTGFTPDSLNTRDVLTEDRPYGSILALSVRKLTVNNMTFDEAVTSELAIGVLGLHLARDLQSWLHRRLRASSGEPRPYDPLGWGNQISDGGEFTALYRVSYERRLLGDPSGPGRKNFQVSGGGQVSAGYYTNATLLSMARWGWFDSDFWEFSPGATNIATQNTGSGSRRQPTGELSSLRACARGSSGTMRCCRASSVRARTPCRPARSSDCNWSGTSALPGSFARCACSSSGTSSQAEAPSTRRLRRGPTRGDR
jgi:hypothetical protein